MVVREYLGLIDRLDSMHRNKLTELSQLKMMEYALSGVRYDVDKVQTSPNQDPLATSVAKVLDIEAETNEIIMKLLKTKQEIIAEIDRISNTELYKVLTMRYIQFKSNKEIANELECSRQKVDSLMSEAHLEFDRKYHFLYDHISQNDYIVALFESV